MNYKRIKSLFYSYAFLNEFILIYPLYAIMFSDSGLNAAQISSLFIAWSLTAFLLEVPSGAIADKYPRKYVLSIGLLIKALAFLIWLLFPTYWGFLIGFLLWGIESALSSGTTEALVYDEMKKVNRSNDYSRVIGTMEGIELGAIILGGFAASLFAPSGYSLLLLLSILICIISAIVIHLLPKAAPSKSTEETKYIDYLKEGVRLVFKNTKVLFIIGFMAITVGLGAVDEYYNLFFKEKGFSTQFVAFLIGAVFLFGAIGSVFAHKLEGKKIPLTSSLFIWAGLLYVSTIVPKNYSPLVIGVYVGFFYVIKVLFNTYLQKEINDKNRATMTSVGGFMAELFALISFSIFAIAGSTSYSFGLQIIAIAIGIVAIIYGLLSIRYNSRSVLTSAK